MLYAVISDIHSNFQAWNAVLLDIRSQDIDRIICLGDIVGYGPDPQRVLASVHSNVDNFTLGNHDAVVCGKMDGSLFNDSAREIIEWTASRLNNNAVEFLGSLPLSLSGKGFRCVHGEFSDPPAFNYLIDPEDALPSWDAVGEQLLFAGHTHCPSIFLKGQSGTPHRIDPRDFTLEEGKRYIVNVGSVGQPRGGDARACYCVYDEDLGNISWRVVPFDLDAYRNALQKAGLPEEPSYFLRHDPRTGTPPLREVLDFSPAANPEQSARNAVEVQALEVLQKKVARWKTLTSAVAAAAVLAAGSASWAWWHSRARPVDIPYRPTHPVRAAGLPHERNLIFTPESAIEPNTLIPSWHLRVGDSRAQSVGVNIDPEMGALFVMKSSSQRNEVSLSSPPVNVSPGMKLCLEAMCRKEDGFDGSVAVFISLERTVDGADERIERFVVKEPNWSRGGGWLMAKKTFEIPAGGTQITYHIRGNFTGTALLRDLRLTRRP
ncbi:MAG: metallophosphoesterase family protein [Kiritimatiellia bacterium]